MSKTVTEEEMLEALMEAEMLQLGSSDKEPSRDVLVRLAARLCGAETGDVEKAYEVYRWRP